MTTFVTTDIEVMLRSVQAKCGFARYAAGYRGEVDGRVGGGASLRTLMLAGVLLLGGCERDPYEQFEGKYVFVDVKGASMAPAASGCLVSTSREGIMLESPSGGSQQFIPRDSIVIVGEGDGTIDARLCDK